MSLRLRSVCTVDDSISPREAGTGECEIGSRLIESSASMDVELDIFAKEEHEATVKVILRLRDQSTAWHETNQFK